MLAQGNVVQIMNKRRLVAGSSCRWRVPAASAKSATVIAKQNIFGVNRGDGKIDMEAKEPRVTAIGFGGNPTY